jgi:ankyrin repeat protein
MDKITQEEATKKLFQAARTGNVAGAQAAIDAGADINAKGAFGQVPLHQAVWGDHSETIKLLIAKGADVNTTDNVRETPLYRAVRRGKADIIEMLEDAAKQQGHAARVTEERKDKGPPQVGG